MVENEETLQKPFVGGFILIGFPQTLEQIEKLKATGIGFDKILHFVDTDEENPGAILKARINDEFYNLQRELENSEKILGIYKEQYEDIVNEISCNGNIEDVLARVYASIDPFYLRVDAPENVRTTEDLGDEDRPLPRGEYGNFCPVTFTNDSWLYPGADENEVQVDERVYKLAGEKEMELFKANPGKYIVEGIQNPPEPHIMLIGPKGSGVSVQIELIWNKYKIPEFKLKEEFLAKLKEAKQERKKQRLLKRGFKPPEPVEDGEEGPPPDPEIEDDPEDFEKEAHEKEILKSVLDAYSPLIIDGEWFDLPDDEIATQYTDLLFDSRRPPEIVIYLSVSEERMLERLLDRSTIETKYQELVDKRNEEKRIKRLEDREAKLKELQEDEEKTPEMIEEEMNEWDKNRDQEEADDDDPEAPNLNAMLDESKEKLIESRNTQSEFCEDFVEKIKEKKVPVVKINGDLSIERVHLRVLSELKSYIEYRNSLFERAQVIELKPTASKPNENPCLVFERSYLYSHSKYGYRSPYSIARPDMNKMHSLLYRDKVYFFANEDEKNQFMMTPDIYWRNPTVPKDVWLKPTCFVLGTPSCGKSAVWQRVSSKTGMVHLKVEDIILEFIDSDWLLGQQLREQIKGGRRVSEDLMVEMIVKRVQFSDWVSNGFLLEDFPKTKNEAEKLTSFGVVPDVIFYIDMYSEVWYERVKSLSNVEFMYDPRIFSQRLKMHLYENPGVIAHYESKFSNIKYVNGLKSKWFIEDSVINHLTNVIKSKWDFARNILDSTKGCSIQNININKNLLGQCLSGYGYYCPVTWKHHSIFANSKFVEETAVLYQRPDSQFKNIYFFRNTEQRDIFLENPEKFTDELVFPTPEEIPIRIDLHNAAQVVTKEKNLANYCPVSLYEEEKIIKGYQLFLVHYKGKLFWY